MKNRTKRLFSIKRIIGTEEISSQEELAIRLKRSGIKVSQSTLSRDLSELDVAKSSDNGFYFIPENKKDTEENQKYKIKQHGLTGSIKSIGFSGNITVIKTLPGYANAVTAVIDSTLYNEILGSIAGDDTIFIVIKENTAPQELVNELSSLFPEITKLYKK